MGVFIIIFFEIVLTAFIIWGLFREDRFIAFERRLWLELKNRKSK